MKNNRGFVPAPFIIVAAMIVGITSIALTNSASNGVLEKQGNVISCEIQGNSKDYCAQKYGYDRTAHRVDYDALRKVVCPR